MAKSRKQILRAAKRMLKLGYIKSEWVVFPGIGSWQSAGSMASLRALAKRAEEKHPNPECRVCAQGAVFLACALDGDEGKDRARSIIGELDQHVPAGYRKSVMKLNDATGIEKVLGVFDTTEKVITG